MDRPSSHVTAVVLTGLLAGPPHVGDRSWALLADEANPLAGLPLYVNPNSAAMRAANADPSSPELAYIANTPQAYWMDQLSTPSVDAKYISTRRPPALCRCSRSTHPAPGLWKLRGRRVRFG